MFGCQCLALYILYNINYNIYKYNERQLRCSVILYKAAVTINSALIFNSDA